MHEVLEVRGCIHEAKGHNVHVPGALRGHEGSEPLVQVLNVQLVVSHLQVKFGEYAQPLHALKDLINVGQGETVLDHDCIEFPVVNDGSAASILLPYKEERGSSSGVSCGLFYQAILQHGVTPDTPIIILISL